jgi:uncharacterized protein YyaL (SSP411 family)
VIDSFIALYQITFDKVWIDQANKLMEHALERFHDEKSKMFFFTSSSTTLIARKMELNDNVIPASNSVMANNLYILSHFYRNEDYLSIAKQMLSNMYDGMEMYGSAYTNWGELLLIEVNKYYEVSIIGDDAIQSNNQLQKEYVPNVLFSGGKDLNLPVLLDKEMKKDTLIYVCSDGTCHQPTRNTQVVLNEITRIAK